MQKGELGNGPFRMLKGEKKGNITGGGILLKMAENMKNDPLNVEADKVQWGGQGWGERWDQKCGKWQNDNWQPCQVW